MKNSGHKPKSTQDGCKVINEYRVIFQGEQLTVQYVCMQAVFPQYFFLITAPEEKKCLIKKVIISEKIYWVSQSALMETADLGKAIEEETGVMLPDNQTNNPFEYKGNKAIPILEYSVKDIVILKANAVFGRDKYYRVILNGKTFSIGLFYWDTDSDEGTWWPVDPAIDGNALEVLSSLVNSCELVNKWKVYS